MPLAKSGYGRYLLDLLNTARSWSQFRKAAQRLAVPAQSIFIPLHRLFSDWGLQNSYAGLALPGLAAPLQLDGELLAGLIFLASRFIAIATRPSNASKRAPKAH